MGTFLFDDDFHGFFMGDLRFINASTRQGVVGVGQSHESARYRNLLPLETFWISRPIPSFMMRVRDFSGNMQKGGIAEVSFSRTNGIATIDGMSFHFLKFLIGQSPGLQKDSVRNSHLADIVERSGFA